MLHFIGFTNRGMRRIETEATITREGDGFAYSCDGFIVMDTEERKPLYYDMADILAVLYDSLDNEGKPVYPIPTNILLDGKCLTLKDLLYIMDYTDSSYERSLDNTAVNYKTKSGLSITVGYGHIVISTIYVGNTVDYPYFEVDYMSNAFRVCDEWFTMGRSRLSGLLYAETGVDFVFNCGSMNNTDDSVVEGDNPVDEYEYYDYKHSYIPKESASGNVDIDSRKIVIRYCFDGSTHVIENRAGYPIAKLSELCRYCDVPVIKSVLKRDKNFYKKLTPAMKKFLLLDTEKPGLLKSFW